MALAPAPRALPRWHGASLEILVSPISGFSNLPTPSSPSESVASIKMDATDSEGEEGVGAQMDATDSYGKGAADQTPGRTEPGGDECAGGAAGGGHSQRRREAGSDCNSDGQGVEAVWKAHYRAG
jgi:hypothetical protein